MSQENDDLWKYVHRIVAERGVPPEHREVVTELAARIVVHVLTTPQFLNGLRVVQELRGENQRLREIVAAQQRTVSFTAARKTPARKRPAKKTAAKAPAKKAPAKKVAAKKAAPRRKNAAAKAVPAAQKRAFKKGARGR